MNGLRQTGIATSFNPRVGEESPVAVVEQFLLLQASQRWEEAMMLVSDDCLRGQYGLFQEACHAEAARKYGYTSSGEARKADTREFVTRMFASASTDAEGTNPSVAAIPDNADCHVTCRGEEVVVTLSTSYAATRTHYRTGMADTGRRLITSISSHHTRVEHAAESGND